MSYDVAFWATAPKCKYSDHVIYRRLRRGLPVQGLRSLPRRKAERIIRGVLQDCHQDGEHFEGRIAGAYAELQLKDDALLADFSLADTHVRDALTDAFLALGVCIYDPLVAHAPDGDHLYDDDYAEVSRDPDPGYWVDLNLKEGTQQRFEGYQPVGAQTVNDVEYVFFKVPRMGVFDFYAAISSGRTSIPADRLNGGHLDGYGVVAAVVIVPAAIILRHAAGYEPREHVRLFTAFADDDKVQYYQTWWPNDGGPSATAISLAAMPKRLKTLVSTRFAHRA